MVCGDCIDKLARRLAHNNDLDLIDALTRAYKGLLRYEERVKTEDPETPRILPGSGNPTDYTQSCDIGTCTTDNSACTKAGDPCLQHIDCDNGSCACSGSCACPDPLPNSHQVSSCTQSCIPYGICGYCFVQWGICVPTCYCAYCPAGSCGYDCDEGYEWTGSECALPSVAKKIVGDGLALAVT